MIALLTVSTQRRQFRKASTVSGESVHTLNPDRKKRLDNLGFQYSAKDPNSYPWEARFKQLKDFVVRLSCRQNAFN